jgi:hypothetical protein
VQAAAPVADAWAELCEQVAWRLLVLTEQLRPAMDGLESSEEDPDRLAQLYQVDHGVTRMRRVARDLRILAGRGGEEIAGHTTSLLDVIRMAASSIEHYGRVSIGTVAELAVVAYAADDVASLLAALADNATRYSPSPVTVSAHLLADGSVMLRVEDTGLGIEPGWLAGLNNALAGPVPAVGVFNGRHTGFAVVHRLARRHGMQVQLARREPPGPGAAGGASGTIAMMVIPAPLLCEIPEQPFASNGRAGQPPGPAAPPANRWAAYHPETADPVPVALPPQDLPPQDLPPQDLRAQDLPPQDLRAQQTLNSLPRREPRSVRTPARQLPAAAGQDAAPAAVPDAAAGGFAFAADLQAFSTALDTRWATQAEAGDTWPGDAEGHMP